MFKNLDNTTDWFMVIYFFIMIAALIACFALIGFVATGNVQSPLDTGLQRYTEAYDKCRITERSEEFCIAFAREVIH